MIVQKGHWALVTGASSGLGIEFAKALAARKINLILTARSESPMKTLAAKLQAAHGTEVFVAPADLSAPGSSEELRQRLEEQGLNPSILVCNAGAGISGNFIEQDPEQLRRVLELDVVSLTELTRLFGQRMHARGEGHILLVASMAAFQPTPLTAVYGAAKAYVLSLGEALHVELAPSVGVTVLCPGLMHTGFAAAANYHPPAMARATVLDPAAVAAVGIDALFSGRSSVVPGKLNALAALSSRFLSRHQLAKMVYRGAQA